MDGWRRTYPDVRAYTHQHAPNASQGRLDRIYISNDLLKPATEWRIDSSSLETDHWMVSVRISTPDAPEIGRGRWQIPMYLFDREEILKEINALGKKAEQDIKSTKHRRSDAVNPQTIFATLKEDITATCRNHTKRIHPTITNKIDKLKTHLHAINNDATSSEEDKMLESMTIKTEILELERILFESNRIYAKAKHLVHAETICRDWTHSNRARKPRDTMYNLLNPLEEAPSPSQDSPEMVEKARNYYENLQHVDRDPEATPDTANLEVVLKNITTRTTPAQKNQLAKYLKWSDVHSAMNDSTNEKSAGLDGIPVDLWKKMGSLFDAFSEQDSNPYCDIVGILTRVFNDIEKFGIVPSTRFNEGWLCPLYKKGERCNIANYRPITILNTDYKIMTKALANKLAEVAPTLIHRDQAGFIKGRSIFDQVKLAKLTIDYGSILNHNGAIVALDQEKAYDKVLHPYLWRVLEKFDIPQHFIKTVKHLYHNARTTVIINSILSEPFSVKRGVRQGDGLSCLLFDLGIEPLAATIRNSPLKGIKLQETPENLKCKLFADDTMVYLDESDCMTTLEEHALNPWCKVSGAVFNISKTEVIPIGSKEFRTNLLETRQTNPNSPPIPANINIAKEGQPTRVLGAWIGNGIDQATPWTPTIEKIAASLKRWEANHPTSEGRRLISQMIIGGMTQYLAKVQGIPETALKTLERLIRKFSWNGESNPTISMAHMTSYPDNGGKKVLDIQARNDAIQLTWVQAYLKMGDERPTWAFIADEIFRNDAPGEPASLETCPNARINQFLQDWHSRKIRRKKQSPSEDDPNIPDDLREMIKVATKYGVRLEATHPAQNVKTELPAIRSVQTKPLNKPDTLSDKHGKCLRNTHNIRTLEDATTLGTNIPNNHRNSKRCRCDKCKNIRSETEGSCKHPNKCIARALTLLNSINKKWNPLIEHPPEFFQHPTPNETGPSFDPQTQMTTHTLNPFRTEAALRDCFRVFTDMNPPPHGPHTEGTEDRKLQPPHLSSVHRRLLPQQWRSNRKSGLWRLVR